MRITFISHFPGRGGSTTLLNQLVECFRERGHFVSIVVGDDAETPVIRGYNVVTRSARQTWRERMKAYQTAIEQTRPDLVYALPGKDEIGVLRFLNCPRMLHVCSLEQHDYIDIPFLLKQAHPFVECYTANTPDVLEQIRSTDGLQKGRSCLAPYRFNTRLLELPTVSSQAKVREELQICFAGRLDAFLKRTHWLPEIIRRTCAANSKVSWHIYGTGPADTQIRAGVKGREWESRVYFYGWVEATELSARMQQHDLFFLCSRWEGLPIAMIEAMLCGQACIVPAIPAGITYILSQGGGWTYKAHSPGAAARAVLAAIRDPAEVLKRRVQAQNIARKLFNPLLIEDQLNELENVAKRLEFNGSNLNIENANRLWPVRINVYLMRKLRETLGIQKRPE